MRKEITIAGLALAVAMGGSSITASVGEHVFADAGTTPSWEYTLNYTYSEEGAVCTATKTQYGTTSQLWTLESLYDEEGNLQEERYSYTTGYNNRRTKYTYDEAGQCIRWTFYTYDIMPTVA